MVLLEELIPAPLPNYSSATICLSGINLHTGLDGVGQGHHLTPMMQPKKGLGVFIKHSFCRTPTQPQTSPGGWHYGRRSKAVTYSTSILFGLQFRSLPLHFWSSSLMMHLRKQKMMIQVLWSLPHIGDPEVAPDSWLQTSPALAIANIWRVNQQLENLSLHFPLCNSAF